MGVTAVGAPQTSVERSLSRPLFSFHVAVGAILCLWVFYWFGRSVADPDIWWHLRNAQYLFATHRLPQADMSSLTVAASPWINHEWLSEIPYYLAYRAFGLQGLFWLSLAVAESLLLAIFYIAYKYCGNLRGSWIVTMFGVMLAVVNFGPRTILFSWICLLLLLGVLWRYQSKGKGPLWIIPPMFCLWINLHGSWLIGLVVFGLIISSGLFSGSFWHVDLIPWSRKQLKSLIAIFCGSVAALFLNPYTYRLVFYPFDLALRQDLNFASAPGWAALDFHTLRGKIALAFLLALLLLALLVRVRWTLQELTLTLFALYASLTYERFLILAVILITPILARRLHFLTPYRQESDRPLLNVSIVALVAGVMTWSLPTASNLQDDLGQKYPLETISYLRTHGQGAKVFTNYNWGGYLSLNVPEIATFVDSRVEILEHGETLKDYLDVIVVQDSVDLLDSYQVRYVLFAPAAPLAYLLENSSRWKVAYRDSVSVLLERAGPSPEHGENVNACEQSGCEVVNSQRVPSGSRAERIHIR